MKFYQSFLPKPKNGPGSLFWEACCRNLADKKIKTAKTAVATARFFCYNLTIITKKKRDYRYI
jgi:hypothetical protein